MSDSPVPYRRVLLKLSGEALMGDLDYGIEPSVIQRMAAEIAAVREKGVEVASWDTMTTWVHNKDTMIEGKKIEDIHVEVADLMVERLGKELAAEENEKGKKAIQKKIDFY